MRLPSDLTEAEQRLVSAVRNGVAADFGPNDPAGVADKQNIWGANRRLRADVVRAVCIQLENEAEIDPKGIIIKGAQISGQLDLESAVGKVPLRIIDSKIDDRLNLRFSHFPLIDLSGTSVVGGIDGERISIEHDLIMCDGFLAKGEVTLLGATIGGNLIAKKATFQNPKGTALRATSLKLGGGAWLPDSAAIGGVDFNGATIGGHLDCTRASFENPGRIALIIDRIVTRNGVFLRHGFSAEGQIRIVNAEIGANLECQGSTFENQTGNAFRLSGGLVKGTFIWTKVEVAGDVQLTDALVDQLRDDVASWPPVGQLHLSGFRCRTIYTDSPRTASDRLTWLRRQGTFLPETYEELIQTFRKMGLNQEAQKVAIAKQVDLRRSGQLALFGRMGNIFLGLTVAYGYRPSRAAFWALLFVIFGWLCFSNAYQEGAMLPVAQTSSASQSIGISQVPSGYPSFSALVYSLDVLLPAIGLHQERFWLPAKAPALSMGGLPSWVQDLAAWRYWILMWVQILAGWLLTTVFVASLTGIIKRD